VGRTLWPIGGTVAEFDWAH